MIPNLVITVDIAPLVYDLEQIHQDQIPFAASRAINDVAGIVQKGQREAMAVNFTIRKPWVLNGIAVTHWSTKKDPGGPYAIIEILPDRAFLAKFEDGGTFTPQGKNFALPTAAVRPTKLDIAPNSIRPQALGSWRQPRGGNQRTFWIASGPGAGLWQRIGNDAPGGAHQHPRRTAIKMLWSFKQSRRINAILGMKQRAQGLIAQWFNQRFYVRLDEAIKTAKPK
jgi:hypothetical protein